MRLAILTTHPIQYYAPLFRLLSQSCELRVFYSWGVSVLADHYDPDFGKNIAWDIPVLEGYNHEFLKNSAPNPGSASFKGIQNPDVIDRISAFQPDAILVYGWAYQGHLKVMRHFKGKIPVWFRGDSTLMDPQGFLKKVARNILLRWVYDHVDLAFYVGMANKQYFKQCGLREDQLRFAPHAVDNDRFSEDRVAEAMALRKSLGIPDSAILVLFAGKFEPKKDPELLLQAFTGINHPNAYLLFVGNGVLENKLKAKAAQLQTPNSKLIFLSFQNQSQMPVIYQACDLFCLPSKGPGETWGLAVNEAMAAGKAILISDRVGAGPDLCQTSNGLVFQSNNLDDLKSKFEALLNEARLKDMGATSIKIIRDWNFENQVNPIIAELKKLNG